MRGGRSGGSSPGKQILRMQRVASEREEPASTSIGRVDRTNPATFCGPFKGPSSSHRFYRRCGFKPTAQETRTQEPSGSRGQRARSVARKALFITPYWIDLCNQRLPSCLEVHPHRCVSRSFKREIDRCKLLCPQMIRLAPRCTVALRRTNRYRFASVDRSSRRRTAKRFYVGGQ